MAELKVLLTGGGTGGHIFPLIAVAQELKKQSGQLGIPLDMRYFGSAREYAQEIVDNGIEFVPVISSKLRRYWSPSNLIDIPKFILSLAQLLWKVFWFMPDVIFSKGGPGALAAVLIGKFYFIPVVIHESDSIPGLTNAISGFLAKKIFLAFSSAADHFKNKDIEIVGNPVRGSLMAQTEPLGGENEKDQILKSFGFNPDEKTILILGGSQGAEKLNNFVMEGLEPLLQQFQILHQTGTQNYDDYKKEYDFLTKDWGDLEKNRYHFRAFFDKDLADALIVSDLVLARAGSGTIFELAAFGKASILVPLPNSAGDHQKENARIYSESGAAIVIHEENLLTNLIIDEVKKILQNKELLQKMEAAARSFYRPDSAALIARHLLTYLNV
mgnify:CR=1 FL=1